ncbi:glycerophosphodiester phosphodiesterase [Sporosarcina sp. YIM B06819]|uniref:glycerophosphodiester phosphodiesterase n=1 Tax=Sporosarcina sp. YIM B06819 TaxID=3081769 RepID=UPI00298CE286|nr:glycerophosphodiester phosphodiesterase family protein [Sporosarcina sp. YIM B06819]
MRKLGKKKSSWLVGLVSACLLLLVGFNEHPPKQVEMTGMISVAHRGASSYAPENTQAAFQKGLELGADFLECDVHLSKDGELIIMHDDKVDRTTNGKGFIKDYTLAELKELDAGVVFDPSFSGEKIITLDELLDEFYGEIGLLIEIKKSSLYPGIEEKVVALLEKHGDVSGIIVQSFDIESMRKIHSLLPELQIAILMKPSTLLPSTKRIEDLTSFATYINFNVSYINKRMVDRIHTYGGKVLVWSKKDQQLIAKAFQYGVDGIITDFSQWPVEEATFIARQ